ncbi:MAG: type II secretion system protein [Phycisphaerales bacterium]|jgi:prepilin-type N-terminal cleavage/methylation domain-containing protein
MDVKQRGSRGFTLIELLVAIAVIALLIGILLPSLGGARRAGWTVRCQANLRSLQVAQQLYADQHRGHLVDVGLSHGGVGDASLSWTRTLESFCEGVLTLRCPADRSPYWPADAGGQGLTMNGVSRASSYGMNNYLSRTYNPGLSPREPFDRLDKIDRPSLTVQFLIMAEQGDYAVSDHPHVEGWGDGSRGPALAARQVQIDRHGGPPRAAASVSNWGFLDTHVETLPFKAVYAGREANAFDPLVARIAR